MAASDRRAPRLTQLDWVSVCYRYGRNIEEEFRHRLIEPTEIHVPFSCRCLTLRLQREGGKVIARQIYHFFMQLEMHVRMKARQMMARRVP